MITLEERFVAALDDLALPPTDLVGPVLADIELEGERDEGASHRWLVGAIAAVFIAATLAIAPVRDAVADWLGLGATEVIVDAAVVLPDSPIGLEAIGGVPIKSMQNPLPAFEEPVAVFDHRAVRGRTFVWAAAADRPAIGSTDAGIVLYVRPIDGIQETKRVPVDGVDVETVAVLANGVTVAGLWIDGAHESLRAGSDQPVLADRVLLWTANNIQYRLEADLGLPEMTRLAESVQGGTDLLPSG